MLAALQPIAAHLRQMRRQFVFWGAAALLGGLAIIFFAMAFYMSLARQLGEPLAAGVLGTVLALGAIVLFFIGRRRSVRRHYPAASPVPPLSTPTPPRPMEALMVAFVLGVIDEQMGRRRRR